MELENFHKEGPIAKVQAASTQQHVPIASVRNGIIILKDGSYRLILNVSPINFSLKSEQEQNALIFNYQGFLNSLHFPIQITMQSKKLDLTPYLQKIKKISSKQSNELIKIQTDDYIDFVSQLINLANIMSKSFYVTVSHVPLALPKVGFLDKLMGKSTDSSVLRITEEQFKTYTDELLEKGNTVASGLASMGLRVKQLTTQEILELFYNLYNPEEAGKERLIDVGEMQSSVVIDKGEAEQAIKNDSDSNEETPQIDNSAAVDEISRRKATIVGDSTNTEPSAAQNPTPQAVNTSTPQVQVTKQEEPPPIKKRLDTITQPTPSTQNQANTPQAAPPPIPQTPTANTPTSNQPPAAPLSDDNVQLK